MCVKTLDECKRGGVPDLNLSRRVAGNDSAVCKTFNSPHHCFGALSRPSERHYADDTSTGNIDDSDGAVLIACNNSVSISPCYAQHFGLFACLSLQDSREA